MKKIILSALLLISLVSCNQKETIKKETTFQVIYMNGDIDTLTYLHDSDNDFYLREGDLRATNGWEGRTLISYVRDYSIIETKNHNE